MLLLLCNEIYFRYLFECISSFTIDLAEHIQYSLSYTISNKPERMLGHRFFLKMKIARDRKITWATML